MVSDSLLCSTNQLGSQSGAGLVVTNQLKAQAQVFDSIKTMDGIIINPSSYGVPSDPFFIDYVASEIVRTKQYKVDVAHFNGDPFYRTTEELRKLNNTFIITDCTAHDLKESIHEWETVTGFYPFKHMINPFLYDLYMRHVKTADIVLVPSRLSKTWIIDNLKVPKEKIKMIRHGTLLIDQRPLPDEFRVGYLGAIGPDKGLKYLFQAWAMFNGDGRLRLAGSNTPNLTDWRSKVIQHNPKSKIDLVGFVDIKWDFYQDCSVYVQPSVTEAFGIPLLEAMASGRPVIASRGVGSAELVKDNRDGILFDARDDKALLAAIQYFHDNPSEIKRMGDNAAQTAGRHSWDNIQKKYIKLYNEILQERSK